MPSVVQTGFLSKEQEEYLKKNDPALYKQVLKRHGSFREKKQSNAVAHNKERKNVLQ